MRTCWLTGLALAAWLPKRTTFCAPAAALNVLAKGPALACPHSQAEVGHRLLAGTFGASVGLHRSRLVQRATPERKVHMAVVDVNVTEPDLDAFLEASLENARNSVKEDTNLRFDVLQSTDDVAQFALVEIYSDPSGPVNHKETEHYLAWREAVADMMASPRKASQWDTVYPETAGALRPTVLVLERDIPAELDITHIFLESKPDKVDEFLEVTLENAKNTINERASVRCDVYQSVDNPAQFFILEVYPSVESAENHKNEEHYQKWASTIEPLIVGEPTEKHYVNHFPSVPGAWRREDGGFGGIFR